MPGGCRWLTGRAEVAARLGRTGPMRTLDHPADAAVTACAAASRAIGTRNGEHET